jgi:hypothetical protein
MGAENVKVKKSVAPKENGVDSLTPLSTAKVVDARYTKADAEDGPLRDIFIGLVATPTL